MMDLKICKFINTRDKWNIKLEIRNNLDYETINKISDFRVINRIIISALTRAIDNAKDNTYKKLSRKRKKGADK